MHNSKEFTENVVILLLFFRVLFKKKKKPFRVLQQSSNVYLNSRTKPFFKCILSSFMAQTHELNIMHFLIVLENTHIHTHTTHTLSYR